MTEEYLLFAKRIGWVGFSRFFQYLKGLLILPLIIKTLGATEYGVWAMVLGSYSILQPLIHLGLHEALLRFFSSKSKKEILQALLTIVIVVTIVGTIVSSIFFLSANIIANLILKEPSATTVLRIAAFYIFIGSLNTILLSSFRVFGMIKKYSIIILTKTILEILLIFFLIFSGFGLIGAISALIISSIVTFIIIVILIISYTGFVRPDLSLIRNFLIFSLPLVPITLLQLIIETSDRYVIGFYFGAQKVGIYTASYNIAIIPLAFTTYLMYVLAPTVFSFYDLGKINEAKTYLTFSWKYLLMISIPSAFGLSILSKPLLLNMTTNSFVTDGMIIIPLVGLSIVLWGMEQIFSVSLLIFKKRKIFLLAFILGSLLNLILNIVFVENLGIIFAAVSTFLAYLLITVIIGFSSRKCFSFNLNFNFIIKCIISSTVMVILLYLLNPLNIIEILISIVLGSLIYFVILILLQGFTKYELKRFLLLFGLSKKTK